ncbi:MAG: PEP-CTERM sorting domain-containing protein [Proteobacteria bacterium]|nr:PEP-CTERM sorting domain-containing protein [Pseudomonadota bacterium]
MKISRSPLLHAFLGLASLLSVSQAANVGFNLATDSVFKSSSGTPLLTGLEGRLGYFAASSTSTVAYNDSEIIALLSPGSTATAAIAALDAKFFSLGTFKFGTYIDEANTESFDYAGSALSAGTFIRAWSTLSTKPFSLEMGGLKPYLYVKTASEYLVIGSEATIPTGEGIDLAGAWGITGVSSFDPDTEETFLPTARLVGSLGSFDAAANSFSTIPEPSSGLLLSLGLPILIALRRSRFGRTHQD